MQIKRIVPLLFGLFVLTAGIFIALAIQSRPAKKGLDRYPVKCCQEKIEVSPIEKETSYPESHSIFLPEDFFTGV